MANTEPMTDEQLRNIRDSRDTLAAHPDGRMLIARYVRHVDALLAEVEWLRAELFDWDLRLRDRPGSAIAIIEAVADAQHAGGNSTVAYISDLLIHQARALLAARE